MKRNRIQNQQFDAERALYNLQHTDVVDCVFAGPADGESALKEARDVGLKQCSFSLRYPLWHMKNFTMDQSSMDELTRAAIWYAENGLITDSTLGGIKAVRECRNIRLSNCRIDSQEFGWKSRTITLAASLENVMVVLSGMSSIEQMADNLGYMEDFKPLSESEKELCFEAADIINAQIAVPCTGCSYCTEGYPMKIAIPQYFSLYNEDMREHLEEKGWTANFANYEIVSEKFGKAKDCIACGQCESVCPQRLPIIEHLKAVSAHFDH